jgi:hypothetical protein
MPFLLANDFSSPPDQQNSHLDGGAARENDAETMLVDRTEALDLYELPRDSSQVQAPASVKLIEVSPKKDVSSASKNTDLLIDLAVGQPGPSRTRVKYKELFSYGQNLLD